MEIKEKDIAAVLKYIEEYWPKITRVNKKDLRSLIGLPNPYIIPSDTEVFQEQYYWDSYPIVRALIDHSKYQDLAIGMVDNLLYLVKRFGIIPNASRYYFLSRSQPPLLSSMVWLVYQKTKDLKWFRNAIELVEEEYTDVWMGQIHLRNYRHVYRGLSRYYDINAIHVLAEAESGWDMTARFMDRCMDFLPVDLNSLLFLYEKDLEKAWALLGNSKKQQKYAKIAQARENVMNELMWDEKTGYFYDYDFIKRRKSHLITTAGMYPLNVGIATNKQADRSVALLKGQLLKKYGVVQSVRFVKNLQWDWPNGWAPIQLRVVEGLMRYGHSNLAKEIIRRWLVCNIEVFKQTGKLWEKYDVVNGKVGVPDRYPTQEGFAWTNATFIIMLRIYKYLLEHGHEGSTPVWLVRGLGWL